MSKDTLHTSRDVNTELLSTLVEIYESGDLRTPLATLAEATIAKARESGATTGNPTTMQRLAAIERMADDLGEDPVVDLLGTLKSIIEATGNRAVTNIALVAIDKWGPKE